MPNYIINIDSCVGKCQSPICTDYSVTLVLACSVAPVDRIPDAKHRHRVYSPLFRLAISGVRSLYSETAAGMNGMSLTKLLSFIFDFPQCCCGVVVIASSVISCDTGWPSQRTILLPLANGLDDP